MNRHFVPRRARALRACLVTALALAACDSTAVTSSEDASTLDAGPGTDAATARIDAETPIDAAIDSGLVLDASITPDAAMSDAAADAGADAPPPAPIAVQILALNDFHGALEAVSTSTVVTAYGATPAENTVVPAGGAAYLATHIEAQRATTPDTILVHAGDLIGATPLVSARFRDEPTIEAMNLLGLEIASVGNHEFDDGPSELLRMQSGGCHPLDGCVDGTGFGGADFTYLAANVEVAPGDTLFPRYVVENVGGADIAFIGMTLEGTPAIVTPTATAGLAFRDEVETVNALVPELAAMGVRAIVVVVHEGGFQATTASLVDGCAGGLTGAIVAIAESLDDEVDIVISGHTHAAYNCEVDGKRVTSALSNGRVLTDIDATIDPLTGDFATIAAVNRVVTRDVVPSAPVAALVQRYVDLAAPFAMRVVGNAPMGLDAGMRTAAGETVMGSVIADAQLAATSSASTGGAVIALMNAGGVRTSVDAGPITYAEIFSVQPFDNFLVTMTLTGAQIERVLEQQFQGTRRRILHVSRGLTYTWRDAGAMDGARIDPASIRLGGVPLDPAASYRVTVNSFLSTGGDGFTVLTEGTDRVGGVSDVVALEAYLGANDPIVPPSLDRIERVTEAALMLRRSGRPMADADAEVVYETGEVCGAH